MRFDDLYVAGCAAALGREERAAEAVASGRYDAADLETDGYLATRVATDGEMLGLAVAAARRALDGAGVEGSDVALVIHAYSSHEPPALLAPASYVQSRTVGGGAVAFELNQHSNGHLVALHLAGTYLTALGPRAAALISAGEPRARRDHYRAEKGIVFGDGGTALVLARGAGRARVRSSVVLSDSRFSDLPQRAELAVTDASLSPEERQFRFLAEHGDRLLRMVQSFTDRQHEAIVQALEEAGAAPSDVGRWVFANTGLSQIDWEIRKAFGIEQHQTTWEWGRTVGHLGAGDQFGGLSYLLECGGLGAGDLVAMCGVGYGFTVSCVVLEVVGAGREGQVPHRA